MGGTVLARTCLFSFSPKTICDLLGQRPTADLGGCSILCDIDTTQMVHPDFDPLLELPNRRDGSMTTVDSQEG